MESKNCHWRDLIVMKTPPRRCIWQLPPPPPPHTQREGGGGWHKASGPICLPLAAPIGLSPLREGGGALPQQLPLLLLQLCWANAKVAKVTKGANQVAGWFPL